MRIVSLVPSATEMLFALGLGTDLIAVTHECDYPPAARELPKITRDALVKTYAADYCDVAELRQASREQVATFIKHLAEYAENDRDGLLCQLAGYGPKPASEALVTIANDRSAHEPEKAAGAA